MGLLLFAASAAVLAIVAVTPSLGADSQVRHCDPYLSSSGTNPLRYRLRGDRCEGLYIQRLGSTPLLLASFGTFNLPQAFAPKGAVDVRWAPSRLPVHVRAYSLAPRVYYRMDSVRSGGSNVFRWATDVLVAANLASDSLGLVAWTEQTVGTTVRDVYLPVQVGRISSDVRREYELLVIPDSELDTLYVSLALLDASGAKRALVWDAHALGSSYYPARRPVRIALPLLSQPGVYLVEISATLKVGGAVSQELWFAHASQPDSPD